MGIVYPQYWLQLNCDDSYQKSKNIESLVLLGFGGSSSLVASLLDCWGLDA
jgi:hypothetical protein